MAIFVISFQYSIDKLDQTRKKGKQCFACCILVFKGLVCSVKKGLHSTTINYSIDIFVWVWLVSGCNTTASLDSFLYF